ncbi:23S rRNA (uracil1939-C5)-methyltransferase [Devosia crocina]|uniref:23S rRNA (Uracil1939-C5)-methyltransferase n=1 Tax=Devosia crocina TaxID=429728 RepID=A0A1I7NTD3_9HYPH|nr:TRAM domain-containing protein [Devosia crocina]SFV37939.1 23S rRNA (uracil1939-C5)-methyltransferase [Devosia crocina]
MTVTTTISSLGHRGEGIAHLEGQRVFVPFALPGERVAITLEKDRGTLVDVLDPAPERAVPFCPHFGICGGCQLQHIAPDAYRAFKTSLVEMPLQQAGLEAKLERFISAGGAGRRRATLHARKDAAGYMRARSHELLDLDVCPILVPALKPAPAIARAIGAVLGECDVSFTATDTGIDVAVRSAIKGAKGDRLVPLANQFRLARLAFNGEMLFLAQMPRVTMGKASVELPTSSFLQATAEAEAVLGAYVQEQVGKAKSVADLFCGIGPFALRLAEQRRVLAFDSDKAGIAALDKARRFTKGIREVTAKSRDLFRDPLTRFELSFDAVVLDPPRAGAEAQVRELAKSKVGTVVMVACDARTFARDAAILVSAGYTLSDLVAVDQFTQSTHIEIAATFRR